MKFSATCFMSLNLEFIWNNSLAQIVTCLNWKTVICSMYHDLVKNIKAQQKIQSKDMISFILTFHCIHHNIFRDTINKYA